MYKPIASRAVAALAAAALLLAACGGDDDSTSSDTDDSAEASAVDTGDEATDTTEAAEVTDTTEAATDTTEPATDTTVTETTDSAATATTMAEETVELDPDAEPIKIMMIYDDTGPGAAPELVDGATAGVNVVNADGGVNGRPVELVSCATGNDPNKADDCSRQAVEEGVVAVVGELTLQKGHQIILTENKIPVIGAVLSGSDFTEPGQFPTIGSTAINIPIIAQALAEGGSENISFARIQVDGGEALPGFANTGLEGRGMEILNDVPVPGGAPDMAPYVEAAIGDGTDGLIIALPGADSTAFIKELKKVAPDLPIGLLGTQREKVFDALGADADGIIEGLFFLPPAYGNDATRAYEAAMSEAGFTETRGYRMNAYVAVLAFAEAARQIDDVTAENLWNHLPTVTGLETGLAPPIQWVEGGVAGLDRVFSSCALITEVQDGQPVPVFDTFKDAFTFEDCPTPPRN
jgi:ABC-type branched-subunit amino acid transport system substrate-binding protein